MAILPSSYRLRHLPFQRCLGILTALTSRFRSRFFDPVDIASIVYFRIVFGLLMLWEVYRYFSMGWISRYWIDPPVNFPYYGFSWLEPLPGDGMYWLFGALGLLSIFITFGFCYRLSCTLFFLGFTYSFLLEQARYLNHFYLIILISFLLIFIPAHRSFSVDARMRPGIASDVMPAWALWILQFQLGVAYFIGGLAKLEPDWLRGEPMRAWLKQSMDFPVFGKYFAEPWAPYLFSYGGLLFDLAIVPLLLWRRSSPWAFGFALVFHLTNQQLFSIGIFPWMMMGATAIFFDPAWPRRVIARLRGRSAAAAEGVLLPRTDGRSQNFVLAALALYVAAQCLLPFRSWLYPGNTGWTEDGGRFAWRMKLRDKVATGQFMVRDRDSGEAWGVNPTRSLAGWQTNDLLAHPHMIWLYARFIEEEARKSGREDVEVYAWIQASVNGRPYQAFIDPTIDLTEVPYTIAPKPWVLPLTTPLP